MKEINNSGMYMHGIHNFIEFFMSAAYIVCHMSECSKLSIQNENHDKIESR